MCAADKPFEIIQDDSIVHDGARQRAWRAAKLAEVIEGQTPSEIMHAQTGSMGARFGIDGLDGLDHTESLDEPIKKTAADSDLEATIKSTPLPAPEPAAPFDVRTLARAISEEVFLLPEQGIIFTKQQLAQELGVTSLAMEAMTDQGYERLGLIRIKPESVQ